MYNNINDINEHNNITILTILTNNIPYLDYYIDQLIS